MRKISRMRRNLRTVTVSVMAAGMLLAFGLHTAGEETEADRIQDQTEALDEAQNEAEEKPVRTKTFLKDITKAVNDRYALSQSYTEAELSMMTNDEIADANQACCKSEEWLFDQYEDAHLKSLNLEYLRDQYLAGLQNQLDAYDCWLEEQDIDAYNELWEAGFSKRASVCVELKKYYGAEFTDISDMEEKVTDLEALDELARGDISEEMTRRVQTALNMIKFPVGEVDGYCGYRTVQMVRRFQKLYGYEPVDGVIDDELLSQLEAEAAKVAPAEEEPSSEAQELTETETGAETEAETEPGTGDETEAETEAETEKASGKKRLG